jgi:Cysteine rich repeat
MMLHGRNHFPRRSARFTVLSLATLVIAFGSAAARSQEAPSTSKATPPDEGRRAAFAAARAACADDIRTVCAGVEPGQGRVAKCIFSHLDQLKPACRTAAEGLHAAAQAAAPCRQDVRSFCGGIERGSGRITDCLKEHASELKPECRTAMESKASKQP